MNASTLDYLALPVSDRLQLVEAIWDSIPVTNPSFFALSTAQVDELDQRWERAKQQPETMRSFEQVREKLFAPQSR